MAKAKLHSATGEFKSDLELPAKYFAAEVSEPCIYLTINSYLAAQRQGTSNTPNRSGVSGTGAKPWKQKGTGRARAGTNTSAIWVRGHKAHGPKPRSYVKKVNKKVKQKALLSALTVKAEKEQIFVFESLAFETPKTSALNSVVEKAGLEKKNTLFLVDSSDANILVTARNLPWIRVMRVQDVNAYELIRARNVVFSQKALESMTGGAE